MEENNNFNKRDFVIINGQKLYDNDLDFSDIPMEQEDINNEESSTGSKGKGSYFIDFEQDLNRNSTIWLFSFKPFGLKSNKLNLFIDLFKIKKIKDLIYLLSEMQKYKNSYFDDLLLLLNQVVKKFLKQSLKDLLLKDQKTPIVWLINNIDFNHQDNIDINDINDINDIKEKNEINKENINQNKNTELFTQRDYKEIENDEEIYFLNKIKLK